MERGIIEIYSKKYNVTIENENIHIELKFNKKSNLPLIISELRKKWHTIEVEQSMYKSYYKVLLGEYLFHDDIITFNIISKIFYPLIVEDTLPKIKSFYITAPVIDFFIDYKTELINNSIKILNMFKNNTEEKESKKIKYIFIFNEKKYYLTIYTFGIFNYDKRFPYDIKSCINVTIDDYFDENEILEIVNIIKLFLQFISNRRIVDIDGVYLMKEAEENAYTAEMNIFKSQKSFNIDRFGVLDYKLLKNYIEKIFQEIANNTICFRSLFNYEEKSITNIDIMNICACFENQFNQTYTDYKDKSFSIVKNDVLKYINGYINEKYNQDCQYHFEEIKKWIGYYKGTLKEKLEYALEDCEKIIEKHYIEFIFGKNYKEMPIKFKNARNALDHGNMEYKFSSSEYKYVLLVRAIVYIMIFKKIGMNNEEIKKCIQQLHF